MNNKLQDLIEAKTAAMERIQTTASALVRVLPSEPSAQVIGKYVDDLNKGLDELKRYGV